MKSRDDKDKNSEQMPQPTGRRVAALPEAVNDQGFSLEALSGSMASLLGRGDDPYEAIAAEEASEVAQRFASGDDPVDRNCPVSPRSIFEAMLFVGHPDDQPLTSQQIASLMRGVRAGEIDQIVEELNAQYAEEGCAYHIETVGIGYRLALRPELEPVREQFYGKVREAKLSQAAIDVLAIVAYHQPITSEKVDELRRAESGRLLSQLVRRELIGITRTGGTRTGGTRTGGTRTGGTRTGGTPQEKVYRTTDRFLQLFGLESLADLPQSHDFDRR